MAVAYLYGGMARGVVIPMPGRGPIGWLLPPSCGKIVNTIKAMVRTECSPNSLVVINACVVCDIFNGFT